MMFSLDNKDAFRFRVFNHVVLYLGFSRSISSNGYVSFNIGVNFVCNDCCKAPFSNKYTLVVIISDNITIWETFQSECAINVILEIFHCKLISEIFIVKLGRFFVNSINGVDRFNTHLWWRCSRSFSEARNSFVVEREIHFKLRHVWKFKNVFFWISTNMSSCVFHDFDTTFSIISYNIASNIRLTMKSINYNSIIRTLFDSISPNEWHWSSFVIITNTLNSILMWFWNLVVINLGLIVLNFNSNSTDLYFILNDVGVNIQSCSDGWASTESDFISLDMRSSSDTLNENSSCLATHYNIFRDKTTILGFQINHNSSRVEMSKRAFVNHCVTFDG